jgi:phosphatidylserine/phosphatidylglycerophosphate/cardiolipin synthase-like enzyme
MIEPLLELPAQLRSRLQQALSGGTLEPPYTSAIIRSELGTANGYDAAAVAGALADLAAQGIVGPAVAFALDLSARTAASTARPDLVWSGPTAPGIHTRSTRQVYEELIATAQHEIWISTFNFWDGQHAFRSLAHRMDGVEGLRVHLLINIARKYGDYTPADDLVTAFASRLWGHDWPGERRPDVYYDPRSVDPDAKTGVLHAKAIVVDDSAAFVTSANLTEAAFDQNIEVGILSRDALLATSLARHFRLLIDHGRLERLTG